MYHNEQLRKSSVGTPVSPKGYKLRAGQGQEHDRRQGSTIGTKLQHALGRIPLQFLAVVTGYREAKVTNHIP